MLIYFLKTETLSSHSSTVHEGTRGTLFYYLGLSIITDQQLVNQF